KTFFETFKAHDPTIDFEDSEFRTIRLLKEVHLPYPEDRLKNFPHQFSGGQLQRIMIALALAAGPRLLIADEPTTALDVTIQAEIVELLKELKIKRKLAVIFITHDIELVSRLADRIIVMYNGLIMEDNTAQNILNRPYHPYTLGLINSLPAFGNHYSTHKLVSIPGTVPDPVSPGQGCPFAPRCPMVKNECRDVLPELSREDGTYRCIIAGSKGETTHG
ncbi:MAG: ABC transporter ATP-binding protein, partial [Spirochaetota bacterium]|nr:ABC transporter ATP-binding protein [Spirochaetota bacterium]